LPDVLRLFLNNRCHAHANFGFGLACRVHGIAVDMSP
jgi:hypothetical protein